MHLEISNNRGAVYIFKELNSADANSFQIFFCHTFVLILAFLRLVRSFSIVKWMEDCQLNILNRLKCIIYNDVLMGFRFIKNSTLSAGRIWIEL